MNFYSKIMLQSQLQNEIDIRINHLYDTIKELLIKIANNGYTKIKIYFPYNVNKGTVTQYDCIINDQAQGLDDPNFNKKLIAKFRSEGINITIYNAFDQYNYHTHLRNVVGKIVKCNWSKDYSKKSCLIS